MSQNIKIIERNRVIGGYSLSVRDNWVYKIKKVHLNESDKDRYIQDFSEDTLITYDEFFAWYKSLKDKKASVA